MFHQNFSYKLQPAGGSTSSFSSRTLHDHSHSSTISPLFTACLFAHILSVRGRKQMFKACSCSAAQDLKTVEMSETFFDGETNTLKACKIETDLQFSNHFVSNSVYMSSFPVIQTILFCFSHTDTFVGSDVIPENYREKKT